MGLARTFTRFDPAWILHEDEHLIAMDKPAGMSSQSARPEAPDDARHRLSLYLAERDAGVVRELGRDGLPYLGVHQRLDQETSGVLLFAKTRAANPGLAAQFEGRTVEKRYRAWVTGGPPATLRLEDKLVEGRDGLMTVRPSTTKEGQLAITNVRRERVEGPFTLVEVRIETGRTHQIRAQLAARGFPLLGDVLYGGQPARRLMLHAEELRLRHPVTQAALRIVAPALPARLSLLDAVAGTPVSRDALVLRLRQALERAGARRYGLFVEHERGETTAFRLLHEAGDGVPGLELDVYGEHLVAQFRDDSLLAHESTVLDVLGELGARGIYLKRRPKQSNELGDTRTEALAPELPARGEPTPHSEVLVHEEGVPYRVRLADGLSTGLFLDQRLNRRRVRELSTGRSVLNLFAYTGPFTVAAVAGGAVRTCTLDVAAPALTWAEQQVRALGAPGQHDFVRADVFGWLRAHQTKGERFDLVIVDPPTYSKTKHTRWTSGADWIELTRLAAAMVAPRGVLLLSSNDRRMTPRVFRQHIEAGLAAIGRAGRIVDNPTPLDFPSPPGGPTMKSCMVHLDVERPARKPTKSAKPPRR
ncbi:MAG: class I SAM-dependent methyltransferase [Sandaracinaceae bacterium]|nr:class I SAM-dependent methyltransferase [Sandaracinaceae bacterium]